jgi:hypothetical protein
MILPKSLLEQVEYYEVKRCNTVYGIHTKIILHFKKWWKWRKVFKFVWDVSRRVEDTTYFKETEELVSVQQQLEEYFKGK